MSTRQAGRFKDLQRVLMGLGCAMRKTTGEIVPTNAGLLFFGSSPQEHIVQSDVACAVS